MTRGSLMFRCGFFFILCAVIVLLTSYSDISSEKIRSGFNRIDPVIEVDIPKSDLIIAPAEAPEDTPFALEPSTVTETDVNTICYGEDDTDTAVVDAVNTTLLALPRWIRAAYISSGWDMCVVSYDIATADYGEQYEEGLVYGSTSYKHRVIKIQNDLRAAANAPLHEFGHWLDAQLDYPTLYDETFLQLFEEEGEIYRSSFNPTCNWDAQEFLAEGFWCYWKSPRLLQKFCPGLHSFIESCLDILDGQYNTEPVRVRTGSLLRMTIYVENGFCTLVLGKPRYYSIM